MIGSGEVVVTGSAAWDGDSPPEVPAWVEDLKEPRIESGTAEGLVGEGIGFGLVDLVDWFG